MKRLFNGLVAAGTILWFLLLGSSLVVPFAASVLYFIYGSIASGHIKAFALWEVGVVILVFATAAFRATFGE